MQGINRWAAISLAMVAVLIAVGIGAGAYQAGIAHGLALQIPAGTTPPEVAYGWYGYGWHRPWGFGLFFPFFFVLLWIAVLRGIFWGGRRRWHYYYRHWDDMPSRFDEWHRRAHEQMKPDASPPTHL
jgi:hypothetical protein